MMTYHCKHGVNTNKINCLLCEPNKKNYCSCNNAGSCPLCKEFKPLCANIMKVCNQILSK